MTNTLVCPICSVPWHRLVERGRSIDFTRFRCADCMAEFDSSFVVGRWSVWRAVETGEMVRVIDPGRDFHIIVYLDTGHRSVLNSACFKAGGWELVE